MRENVLQGVARQIPSSAYFDGLRIRSYEVGRDGMVTPGTVLRYLEHLATTASADLGFDHRWYEEHGTAWFVREMSIRLGMLPGIDDDLQMATWVSDARRVQAHRECAIWEARSGRLVARARARWAYVNTTRGGQPERITDELAAKMGLMGYGMHPHPMLSREMAATSPRHAMRLTARTYEEDVQQHINNCVYVDWLSEALHRVLATEETIAPQVRLRPRYYHIEYMKPTLPGDIMRVETTTALRGSRGLAVWQDIYNESDDTSVLRAYSEHLLL